MDTLLINGDHATNSRGIPIAVTGEREVIQRALLRLAIKKGSFACDPELGSELYKLRGSRSAGDLARTAQSYVQEALLPMTDVTVTGVELEQSGADGLRLSVSLATQDNQYQLEVDVN